MVRERNENEAKNTHTKKQKPFLKKENDQGERNFKYILLGK